MNLVAIDKRKLIFLYSNAYQSRVSRGLTVTVMRFSHLFVHRSIDFCSAEIYFCLV